MAKGVFGFPGLRFSGRFSDGVIVPRKDGGFVLRELPGRLPPRTARQRETAGRFAGVAEAWRGLSAGEVGAWREYAKGVGRQPYQAFTGLATKRLQIRPLEAVPSLPPSAGFLGDGIVVTAGTGSPSQNGSFLRGGQGGELPEGALPLPQPPLQDEPLGEGAIVFQASGANSAGVETELLVQRLRTRGRAPVAGAYGTARFVGFAAGELEAVVPCGSGVWACAVRFVRVATGQETGVVELGVVEVG